MFTPKSLPYHHIDMMIDQAMSHNLVALKQHVDPSLYEMLEKYKLFSNFIFAYNVVMIKKLEKKSKVIT
jgi:hypothetical protein